MPAYITSLDRHCEICPMTDAYFFSVLFMVLGGTAAYGLVLYALGRRSHRRFVAERRELIKPTVESRPAE